MLIDHLCLCCTVQAAYANAVPELWQGGNGEGNTVSSTDASNTSGGASSSTVAAAMAAAAQAASALANLPPGYEPAPESDDDDDFAEDLARIPCRDHWSGYRCLSGERCRFMHDRDQPVSSSSSSSSIPEGAKKRRTESGSSPAPPTSIAVNVEDKSDDHVKSLLYKYMKTAMAVSPKMIEFLKSVCCILRFPFVTHASSYHFLMVWYDSHLIFIVMFVVYWPILRLIHFIHQMCSHQHHHL
jgi:hypothetical protein